MRQRVLQSSSITDNTIRSKRWWCCFFVFFLSLYGIHYPAVAAKSSKPHPTQESTATLADYLLHEKNNLIQMLEEAKTHVHPVNAEEYQARMERISSILRMTAAKIDSLEGFLDNQLQYQEQLGQRLKHLQQLPLMSGNPFIQERVAKTEQSIATNKKSIDLINDALALAKKYQALLNDEVSQLHIWKSQFDLEQQLVDIKNTRTELKQATAKLYQTNVALEQNKNPKEGISSKQVAYETHLFINNQRIALIHYQLNDLALQKSIINARILLLKNSNTKNLQFAIDAYKDALHQYAVMQQALEQMQGLLEKNKDLPIEASQKKASTELHQSIKKYLKEVQARSGTIAVALEDYQNQLKQLISSRQSLAEYNINSWPFILKKLMDIPNAGYKYIKILALKVYDSYSWMDTLYTVILWSALACAALFFFVVNRILKKLSNTNERSRLSGYLYDGILTILQRNIPYLCAFTMVWIVLLITNISYVNYQLLFNLIAVWFTFRVLILIARLALLERISDATGKDVKLYYRLKWLLLFGGWATALMVFSYVLPLSPIVQDIFNRLFMLFILAVSLVAWKSKDVIPHILRPLLKSKRKYFKNVISLLVILIPVTLFTTAMIGLLGFVNLAWTMSRYQVYVLEVLVAYILARGLLFDALELFSEWMISSLKNGWLWIEVFLKPIDAILRILLILASFYVLFMLFDWHSDSMIVVNMAKIAQYSIVNITGIHITVSSIFAFLILFAVFAWASKWTREFCYRWLFSSAKDVGIRNSLSVFTQYAVVLLGAFIALHVLGLDFSGMSMILGGLAVGMGFGLRDFASNIVGGIMLLIERPVREGDLITIGEHEGQVAHIGIRSMRVSSWDNTQVLIPNAETFNKPFTNWTHQDGIVRTVIPIKVSRADDPVIVQQLILDVLAIIPEIVPDPPAQVFLKKIDAALIEFEARYFINVQAHNRVEIRSKVLFAITAQFKAAGIKHPIEPITVEFKEGQGGFHAKQTPSQD